MATVVEELKRGLTAKVIVTGVIAAIILSLWGSLIFYVGNSGPHGGGEYYMIDYNTTILGTFGAILFVTMVLAALSPVLKFSSQELACLYTMVLVIGGFTVLYSNTIGFIVSMAGTYLPPGYEDPNFLIREKYYNQVLIPFIRGDSLEGWRTSIPIPSVWYPTIIFNSIYFGSACLFFVFGAALLRKQLVEVEALPFPLGQSVTHIAELARPASPVGALFTSGGKWFWLGVLIALAIWGGTAIQTGLMFPVVTFLPTTRFDLTPYSTIPYMFIFINLNPTLTAFCYLMPTDIILSIFISIVVVYFILSPGLYPYFGMPMWKMGTAVALSVDYVRWGRWVNPPGGWSWTKYPFHWFGFGVLIAFFIWTIWMTKPWRALKSKEKEWMRLFIGFVVFGAIWTACYAYTIAAAWWLAIIAVLWYAIWQLGAARWRGDCGALVGQLSTHRYMPAMATMGLEAQIMRTTGIWGDTLFPENGLAAAPGFETVVQNYGHFSQTHFGRQNWFMANPLGQMMDGFAIGRATKTRSKDILYAGIIATVVTVPLMMYLCTYWRFYINFEAIDRKYWAHVGDSHWSGAHKESMAVRFPMHPNTFMHMPFAWDFVALILGFVFCILLYVLRGRFPKLFYHPAGVLFAFGAGPEFFIPSLLAYVIKTITIRVGGARLHEERGIPVASGIMAGTGLLFFVTSAIVMLRAFKIIGPP